MRAQIHFHGMAVIPGMLLGCHVGVAGPGYRVLVSSTLHAGLEFTQETRSIVLVL